jgi:hypothetical protein
MLNMCRHYLKCSRTISACVLPVKNLEPMCTTGNNSPAASPRFVDISLNATTKPAENGLSEDEVEGEEG